MRTDDFKAVYGIGDKGAGVLVAAIELGKRIAREQVKSSLPDFSTPTAVAHYVMEDMRHLGQEQFCVALLNVKNGLIAVKTLSKGSLNMSLAKARDVFKEALRYNAAAVILIHIPYTIINGIFKNRLNDQLYCTVLINLFINIKFDLKTLLISNFLNIHIASAMLDLIRYSDHRSAL